MKYVYSWYDTPDGKDLPQKMNYLLKRSFLVGTSLYPIATLLTQPTNLRQFGMTYMITVVPVMGMSAAFAFTTTMLCRHAPIDPKISYAAGGFAAGAVFGAATRNVKYGWLSAVYLAMGGAIARAVHELDYTWMHKELASEMSIHMEFGDHTGIKEPPRPLPSSLINA